MVFCETRFAQSELMVYKNFEKDYKTYRTTWSGKAVIVEPKLDADAIVAIDAVAVATAEATAAEASVATVPPTKQ